ncbi:MAG: AAA family ATPase [Desulfobacteraceae bacterium]|nr:AAA family ATPase [Desulfobacteraceae bacterium]
MQKEPVIIAVCGKGGVGKTCISALIVKMLSRDPSKKVLAIDADPAVGLSFPLGVTVKKTVDDIRNDLITRLKNGEPSTREELINSLDYELFSALEERENLAFLAIGRPEGDGCYCRVNALLKDIIKEIAGNFDYVVIDGEAGVEQISRRVMEMVTHLLLVSDASLKGRKVVETIKEVAQKKCSVKQSGLIFNKMRDQEEIDALHSKTRLFTCGAILENETIRTFDREGRSFFELPGNDTIHQLNTAIKTFLI